ncbi:T9SS type A sorting domain-containing protein [candidate division KSB1 bacterium]|nr:T9SS type A sorting domain-containing protein [candidate division KSB1 bacterium]
MHQKAAVGLALLLICPILDRLMDDRIMAWERSAPLVVDHTCTDLSRIPSEWIETIKTRYRIYYGHASHGHQLIAGLEEIHTTHGAPHLVAIDYSLPIRNDALCMLHQGNDPAAFYAELQSFLNANPTINIAMFSWCGEAGYNDWQTTLDEYLQRMQAFEEANPDVTLVYMTGHAQEADIGGVNRYQFNQRLRQFVIDNNRVLFDFADIDAWYEGEQHTFTAPSWTDLPGQLIPQQHPHYYGEIIDHTTLENCVHKGTAVWWMLAKMAGWTDAVPVELAGFSARRRTTGVLLSWQTASESGNLGFQVERSDDGKNFSALTFIAGEGTTQVTQNYAYLDDTAQAGKTIFYRLLQIDRDGSCRYSSIIRIHLDLPTRLNLEQNRPNPFNPCTEIGYEIADTEHVSLKVFDLHGRRINTLIDNIQPPGSYLVRWNGLNFTGEPVGSGVYLYQLRTDGWMITKKMLLVR